MAFEKLGNLLGGSPEKDPNPGEQEPDHHVGSGEPMEKAQAKEQLIAREITENDEQLRTARLEGDLTRVRELTERSQELVANRNQLLRETAKNRHSGLAG